MASVRDVAQYVLSKTGKITTWKLQKLIYHAQAWRLVWDENLCSTRKFMLGPMGQYARTCTASTKATSRFNPYEALIPVG